MQKHDLTPEDFGHLGAPELVYVREVIARELFGEAAPSGIRIDPDATLYAVHAADGTRLAVHSDRKAAFAAARTHELNPVSVH